MGSQFVAVIQLPVLHRRLILCSLLHPSAFLVMILIVLFCCAGISVAIYVAAFDLDEELPESKDSGQLDEKEFMPRYTPLLGIPAPMPTDSHCTFQTSAFIAQSRCNG